MKQVTSLHQSGSISHANIKPSTNIQWDENASFHQMTLTLIHSVRYQSKFKNLQKRHGGWLDSWSAQLKRKITNQNLQQALLKAMERWCSLYKNTYEYTKPNINHNSQLTISNFLDYTALCLKYTSHQNEKSTAIMLLHLMVLHTNPGTDTHNIQKYYTLKNTLQILYRETSPQRNAYKTSLLLQDRYDFFSQFLDSSNLINLSLGLMIGLTFNYLCTQPLIVI